jgi:hypothetical protein
MEPSNLLQRLVAAYGDAPSWEVTYHRYQTLIEGTYGFFVAFDRGTITLAEARSLVDELRDGVPVILHERDSSG